MPQFGIYSKELLVGWSALELGDAPMGVAFGRFVPTPSYRLIQAQVIAAQGPASEGLHLSARDANGTLLECIGVCISDHSAELGASGREVSVIGISDPQYAQLFPLHVAAYERQFPSGD
ncbi:hypothetical protein NG831_20035 [Xanthomonas sacchari]|uniref:hypothetical protein n=1 Tax=Xanthomonas TaxID=338 RepID=UPI002259CFB4|nr:MULTISPECIES: hypothetical protein [Xanthomonas]MCW0389496.1 hypothetical protein [Xanthomonas sacchari]MCW0411543.1 hypothetical protein [Xanthomonas sacchari]MCW0448924.1 hypothetical protein [Xanthomonas sacchari]MDY4282747.1 hypothetical protein [Xanthomonas sp. LF06-19]UYK66374.1 hypothetical protein NG831_20035 [Xanthomonas sacchari]